MIFEGINVSINAVDISFTGGNSSYMFGNTSVTLQASGNLFLTQTNLTAPVLILNSTNSSSLSGLLATTTDFQLEADSIAMSEDTIRGNVRVKGRRGVTMVAVQTVGEVIFVETEGEKITVQRSTFITSQQGS